jgi:hypothetical protein
MLERRLELGKSQLGAILSGRIRRPPDWQVIAGLVKEIGEHAAAVGRADRLSMPTSITEYWRPRFAVLEHAFSQSTPRPAESAGTAWTWVAPAQLPHALRAFAGREDGLGRPRLSTSITATPRTPSSADAISWSTCPRPPALITAPSARSMIIGSCGHAHHHSLGVAAPTQCLSTDQHPP